MNDVTAPILHGPAGCDHCHSQGALMLRAEEAAESDFFIAAPGWAKEAIDLAMTDFYCLNDKPIFWTQGMIRHLNASISTVRSVNRNCEKQITTFTDDKARPRIKRHKQTRSQIRANKGSKSEDKKAKKR